jgi:hypothetical protein
MKEIERERKTETDDVGLELGRFPVKDVARFQVVLDHADRAVCIGRRGAGGS